MDIEEGVIRRDCGLSYHMKNYGDLGALTCKEAALLTSSVD